MGEHELTDIFTGVRNPRPFSADALPPYPGYDVLEPPSLPPMPRLLADPAAAGKLLVRAYKAACWKNYGKKPRTDKQVTFRMRHAAFAMREQGIESPYAWAAFRLHTWRLSLLAETTHPAIDYVFSRKVVEDHAEHFAGVAERYEVRRHIVLPESHQLLVVLWARARRALASPGNADKTDEEIVEGILPRERYDQLIAAAQHEGRALVADAMRRLGRGEWIW